MDGELIQRLIKGWGWFTKLQLNCLENYTMWKSISWKKRYNPPHDQD
jgi:hypothetical protein